jgi:hypothetical protein
LPFIRHGVGHLFLLPAALEAGDHLRERALGPDHFLHDPRIQRLQRSGRLESVLSGALSQERDLRRHEPRALTWAEARCEPRLKQLGEMPASFGNVGCQPFKCDIVVGCDSHQQRLEHVGESVRNTPLTVVLTGSDPERLCERIEVSRRQRRNQDRCQLSGIERSLFQANAFCR